MEPLHCPDGRGVSVSIPHPKPEEPFVNLDPVLDPVELEVKPMVHLTLPEFGQQLTSDLKDISIKIEPLRASAAMKQEPSSPSSSPPRFEPFVNFDEEKIEIPLGVLNESQRFSPDRDPLDLYSDEHAAPSEHNEVLNTKNELPRHQSLTDEFKCNVCDEIFMCFNDMTAHKCSRHSAPPPICNDGVFASPLPSLGSHLTSRNGNGSNNFLCSICGKYFPTKRKCKSHMRSHTKPYQCTHCERAFSRRCLLADHISMHSNKRDHKCGECGRGFNTSLILKMHKVMHEPPGFTCAHCNKSFVSKPAISHHMVTRHNPPSVSTRFRCFICVKSLSSKFCLKSHLKTHNMQCVRCDFVGYDLSSLRDHMTVAHIDEIKIQCAVCKLSYLTAEELTGHECKPYRCTICLQRWRTEMELDGHIHNKHGIVYICDICSKSFSSLTILNQHKLTHTKLYQCCKCNRTFHTKSDLAVHSSTCHSS